MKLKRVPIILFAVALCFFCSNCKFIHRAASLEQFLLNIESDLAEEQCPEFQISDL